MPCRNLFLTHKDTIKKKLKMKARKSVIKVRARLSSSSLSTRLSTRSAMKVTKSVVGLEDPFEDEEFSLQEKDTETDKRLSTEL